MCGDAEEMLTSAPVAVFGDNLSPKSATIVPYRLLQLTAVRRSCWGHRQTTEGSKQRRSR